MPAPFLFALYLVLTFAPLLASWSLGLPRRPLIDEISSGLAMVAFASLLAEFLLSGRFRFISDKVGIDRTMRLHQLIARGILVLVLVHPFIYSLPIPAYLPPWDPSAAEHLRLDGASLMTGAIAWLLLISLILTSIARDALPYSYETWRLGHGLGAVLIAALTAHHTLEAGRYAANAPVATVWFVLLAIALASLVWVYLITPLRKLANPFRVLSSRKIAERTWELVITRKDGAPFAFDAGQFVWLSLASSPFTVRENPFSIASAPYDETRVEFVIKAVGDFTRSLDQVAADQPAWVDGPHGALKLPGADVPGIGLIAGGVGVAPLLSILRQLRATGDPRPVTLLYGNRLESQIVYPDELDAIDQDPLYRVVNVVGEPSPEWTGLTGVIDAANVEAAFGPSPGSEGWTYLLCGPPPMLDAATTALIARGVPTRNILMERFVYD